MPSLLSRSRSLRLPVVLLAVLALVSSWPAAAGAAGPGGRLSGVVRDNTGAAQAVARVVLIGTAGDEADNDTTDSAGRFSVDVKPGRYDVAVVTQGPVERIARVRGVEVGVDSELDVVVLPPYAKLGGVVRDRSGTPLAGVEVHLGGVRVRTDGDGRYSLEIRPGTFELELSWSTNDRSTWLVASIPTFTVTEDRIQDFTFALTQLKVDARSAGGAPLAVSGINASSPNDCHSECRAGFEFFPGSGEARGFWRTCCQTASVPVFPGDLQLTVSPADPAFGQVTAKRIDSPWPDPLPIVMPDAPVRPAEVTWKGVVRHNGVPVPDAKLGVGNSSWEAYDQDETDSQGRFEVQITPGTQRLELSAPIGFTYTSEDGDAIHGLRLEVADFEVTTGRTMDINIPTEDFGVTVLDPDGHPAAQVAAQGGSYTQSLKIFPDVVATAWVQNSKLTDTNGKATFLIFPDDLQTQVSAGGEGGYGWATVGHDDQSVTIRLTRTPPEVTLSGTVRDARGPLPLVNGPWASFGGPVDPGDEFDGSFIGSTGGYDLSTSAGHKTLMISDLPEHEDGSTGHYVATPTLPKEWTITTEIDLPESRTLDLTIPDAGPAHFRAADTNGDPQPVDFGMGSTHTVGLGSGLTGTAEVFTGEHNALGPFQHMMFGPAKVDGQIGFGGDTPQRRFYNLSLRAAPGDHFVLAMSSDYDGGVLMPSTGSTTTTTTPNNTAPPTTTTQPPANPGANTAANTAASGYWALASDGKVYSFGDAAPHGNTATGAVDLEPTPTGKGYWTLNRNGTVSPFGDATPLGNVEVAKLAKGEEPASLSATPSGRGYWVFTNTGRVLDFGDAPFLGDMSKTKLNGPVLGSVATPSGRGYYMVASDGGIFAFGDAAFAGSMGGKPLNKPVQSLVPDSDGVGYWLVASDGGIFAFDAPFRGSMGATRLNKPVVGMVRYGDGYLMVGADGGIFNFSTSPFAGSLGDKPPASPVVAVAALP